MASQIAVRQSSTARPEESRPALRTLAEALLIAGTALAIYWQPLSHRLSLKASDIVFALALFAWIFYLARDPGAAPALARPRSGIGWCLAALVISVVVATGIGYGRYDLTMTRNGVALLARLAVCLALFAAVTQLARRHPPFRQHIAFALLSPVLLFPAMLVPGLSAGMWLQGRFQGLTVNPNTADLAFVVALAIAATWGIFEIRARRLRRGGAFALAATSMLVLIVWTQSRAYVGGALVSVILATLLSAEPPERRRLRAAALAAAAFLLVVGATLQLAPRSLLLSYLARVSWGTLAPASNDTQTGGGTTTPGAGAAAPSPGATQATAGELRRLPSTPPPDQAPAESSWVFIQGRPHIVPGRTGGLSGLDRLPAGVTKRIVDNPHLQAAILYAGLVPADPLGFGVNYEQKFFLRFPWSPGQQHGANSILDIPIYGGVGAVTCVAYLVICVARAGRRGAATAADQDRPCLIGAVAAFAGLWVAALLLGSPIFDYEFWIVTAIALA